MHFATLPGEIKTSNFLLILKKKQTNSILIASTFVIRPQILIFSVFKIANLFPYWSQIKFFMLRFFYIFILAINSWHRKFVIADVTAVFVNNQHDMKRQGQDFDQKKSYLKGYTAKSLTDEFLEKSWTKHDVTKLFKKLRDTYTDTVNRRPGSGRPRSAHTEENAKLLLQKFPQSATDCSVDCPVKWPKTSFCP